MAILKLVTATAGAQRSRRHRRRGLTFGRRPRRIADHSFREIYVEVTATVHSMGDGAPNQLSALSPSPDGCAEDPRAVAARDLPRVFRRNGVAQHRTNQPAAMLHEHLHRGSSK